MGIAQTIKVSNLEFVAEFNTHYQSSNYTGFDFLDIERERGYWVSNAALTWNEPIKGMTISAFVANIENQRRGTFSFYNPPTSTISETTTAPRTYGVRIGMKF